jgi:hypothetical protein
VEFLWGIAAVLVVGRTCEGRRCGGAIANVGRVFRRYGDVGGDVGGDVWGDVVE